MSLCVPRVRACVGVVVRKLTEWICLLQISSNITECDYDTEKDEKHKGWRTMCCITLKHGTQSADDLLLISQRETNRKTSHLLSKDCVITLSLNAAVLVFSNITFMCADRVRKACTRFCYYCGNFQMECSSAMWDKLSQWDPRKTVPASAAK